MMIVTRALAVLLVAASLSACASSTRPDLEDAAYTPDGYVEAVDERVDGEDLASQAENVTPAAHRHHRDYPPHRHDPRLHYHEEPSPEAQRFAEAALIVTGSAFLCTFVVVVLDGACNFGVGFGYHYY